MRLSLGLLAALGLAAGAAAQTNAPSKRVISLDDAVQAALEHNLDIQIERYNPQVRQFVLNGAYGGFEPSFSVSGQHNYSLAGGGVDPNTKLPLPASEIKSDSFSSSVGGVSPLGTTYNFFSSISES